MLAATVASRAPSASSRIALSPAADEQAEGIEPRRTELDDRGDLGRAEGAYFRRGSIGLRLLNLQRKANLGPNLGFVIFR